MTIPTPTDPVISALHTDVAAALAEAFAGIRAAMNAMQDLTGRTVYDHGFCDDALSLDMDHELAEAARHLRNADRILSERLADEEPTATALHPLRERPGVYAVLTLTTGEQFADHVFPGAEGHLELRSMVDGTRVTVAEHAITQYRIPSEDPAPADDRPAPPPGVHTLTARTGGS